MRTSTFGTTAAVTSVLLDRSCRRSAHPPAGGEGPTMGTPAKQRHGTVVRRDALIALAVAALLVLGSDVRVPDDLWAAWPRMTGRLIPPAGVAVLLLAESLPLVFRRVAPLPVLAICAAASLGLVALGAPTPLPLG